MGSEMSGHVEELLKAPLEENIYSRVTQVFFIKHLSFESRGPDSGFGGAYRCWEAFVTRAVEEQGLRVKLTRTCALPRHWTTGVCVIQAWVRRSQGQSCWTTLCTTPLTQHCNCWPTAPYTGTTAVLKLASPEVTLSDRSQKWSRTETPGIPEGSLGQVLMGSNQAFPEGRWNDDFPLSRCLNRLREVSILSTPLGKDVGPLAHASCLIVGAGPST